MPITAAPPRPVRRAGTHAHRPAPLLIKLAAVQRPPENCGMPQLLIVNWYVLTAPAATPRAIIKRLNAEVVKVMQAPETRTYLAGIGGEPISSTPEQAAAFLRAETERWGAVIRAAGIKAE